MVLPSTTLVVPDGTGARAVRSVAWSWESNVGVVVPVEVIGQDGTAVDLGAIGSCSLAFWESELDDAPILEVALVRTAPVTEGDPINLGTFTVAAAALEPGPYAVGAKIAISGVTNTVLVLGRLEVRRRAA